MNGEPDWILAQAALAMAFAALAALACCAAWGCIARAWKRIGSTQGAALRFIVLAGGVAAATIYGGGKAPQPDPVSNFKWKTKNGTAILDKALSAEGEVAIPAKYNGFDVVEIADHAFFDASNMTAVTLPASLERIGVKAFKNCSALEKVVFQGGCAPEIAQAAFQNCSSLGEFTVPDGMTYLWSSTFEGCTALERVTLPDGLTAIGTSAFANCRNLVDVNIPETVKTIKSFAFFSCESLGDVWLPNGLKTIEQKAFKNCLALEEIDLPDITSLGKAAFFNTGLGEVFVPGTAGKVDDYCFQKCASLRKVTLEDGIVATGASCWANDEALEEVVFPTSLEDLGGYAFYRCAKLKTLGNFAGLDALEAIGEKVFKFCASLKTLTLPGGIRAVPREMCSSCTALETVECMTTLESTGLGAFGKCPALKSISGIGEEDLKIIKRGYAWERSK